MQKSNITSIAKEAGVSPATVSRFLSGSASVSQTKKDLIERAIEKCDYSLPKKGRSGRPRGEKENRQIAIYYGGSGGFDQTESNLSRKFNNGVIDVLNENNYDVIIIVDSENRHQNLIKNNQVSALIIRNMSPETLLNRGYKLPMISVFENNDIEDSTFQIDRIEPDNFIASKQTVHYLLNKKCKSVLCLESDNQIAKLRNSLLQLQLQATQITYETINTAKQDLESIIKSDLIKNYDALFLPFEYANPLELRLYLSEAKIELGKQLQLVTYSNYKEQCDVEGFLCIDIQPYEIGRAAGHQLLWRLQNQNESSKRVSIPTQALSISS